MNLYVIAQSENHNYDTFDSAVVCCDSEDEARNIHPASIDGWEGRIVGTWATSPDNVTATKIGVADATVKRGVVCASFNAG